MTVRNLSLNPDDFKDLIGKTVRNRLFAPVGKVVEIIDENDGWWHHDNVYMVLDNGERCNVNKIIAVGTSIEVAY
jgi:hypothetical protein